MREIRTSGSQRGKATSDPSGVPSLLYCEICAIRGFETVLIRSDSYQYRNPLSIAEEGANRKAKSTYHLREGTILRRRHPGTV